MPAEKHHLKCIPLGIGGKADPPRLVFNVPQGAGVNVSIMDMGNRFRMLINPCKVVKPNADLPKLPVARVVWQPLPDLKDCRGRMDSRRRGAPYRFQHGADVAEHIEILPKWRGSKP